MKAVNFLVLISLLLLTVLVLSFKSALAAEPVRVMVLDTGVAIDHPSYSSFKRFYFKDSDIDVDHSHGTGITSLVLNGVLDAQNQPTSRVCDNVELYVCNYRPSSAPTLEHLHNCLSYAMRFKIDIINYSSNGPDFNQVEYTLINALSAKGVKFVTASGNDGLDLRQRTSFPALYSAMQFAPEHLSNIESIPNVIAVGALNPDGTRWNRSNYNIPMQFELGVNTRTAHALKTQSGIMFGLSLMTGTSGATALHTNKLVRKMCRERNEQNNSGVSKSRPKALRTSDDSSDKRRPYIRAGQL